MEQLVNSLVTVTSGCVERDKDVLCKYSYNERKSEQAHIPHTLTLLENAVYN